jgi:predicted  nucleic acid-binding Zn-ribbon protein
MSEIAITADLGDQIVSAKSGAQKRFDQLTREKYHFKRQFEAAAAEAAELRTVNIQLQRENAESRNELQQAKSLLQAYRAELEKYRAKFAEIAATKEKPKHAR